MPCLDSIKRDIAHLCQDQPPKPSSSGSKGSGKKASRASARDSDPAKRQTRSPSSSQIPRHSENVDDTTSQSYLPPSDANPFATASLIAPDQQPQSSRERVSPVPSAPLPSLADQSLAQSSLFGDLASFGGAPGLENPSYSPAQQEQHGRASSKSKSPRNEHTSQSPSFTPVHLTHPTRLHSEPQQAQQPQQQQTQQPLPLDNTSNPFAILSQAYDSSYGQHSGNNMLVPAGKCGSRLTVTSNRRREQQLSC